MKLLSYEIHGMNSVGVLSDSGEIIDVQAAYNCAVKEAGEQASNRIQLRDVVKILEAGEEGLQAVKTALEYGENASRSNRSQYIVSKDAIKLLAPVLNPQKITCVGLNYLDHAKEGGHSTPTKIVLFSKYNTSINHPGADVAIPAVSDQVDWEGELAVVIGRKGKNIKAEDAMDYVAGYTVFNDVSVRDFQLATPQYLAGKSFDGHAPMGPYLVLKDEIPDPHSLDIKTEVDDEVVQHANTGDMIFKIPELIAFMSQLWTIVPGDILATGTMAGVGLRMQPPRFLKDGEIVRVSIENVGVLENRFVQESNS